MRAPDYNEPHEGFSWGRLGINVCYSLVATALAFAILFVAGVMLLGLVTP